jgi:hypothetical protein
LTLMKPFLFLYAFKISSPTDKKNTNESKNVFLHKISQYFVCIFSFLSIIIEI